VQPSQIKAKYEDEGKKETVKTKKNGAGIFSKAGLIIDI